MCPYPLSESVGHGDYHFCGRIMTGEHRINTSLHVRCNLLFDTFIVMIGHHVVPRLMSDAWYQLMHACIVLLSHEHHWYGLNVPSHWSQVCYIDSTDRYLPTITFHHLCADLSFNAKVQGLQIQTRLIWSHDYTNLTREKDHTCSCQRFTDIINSISWYITFKKKSMVIWSGRKW